MNVKTKKEVVVFFKYLSRLGLLRGLYTYFLLRFVKKETIKIPSIPHPVFLRKNTSDIDVFDQIFIKYQYNFPLSRDIHFIIDCGANIGLASVFFAVKFPMAKIIAIEPEQTNFEVLQRNCKPYGNIVALNKAIWYKKDILQLQDPGLGHYGFMTAETSEKVNVGVEAISIHDVLMQFNIKEIDVLKIDIEGAEKEVFTYNYDSWLPKTKVITIELHDRLKPGTSTALIKALSKYEFTLAGYGESFLCHRTSN